MYLWPVRAEQSKNWKKLCTNWGITAALLANLYTIRPFTAPFSHYAAPSRLSRSTPQLGEDERENHHARFPEYSHSRHQRQR